MVEEHREKEEERERESYFRLIREINEHDYRYYVLDSPVISDREYDALYKRLVEIERRHPDWIVADSPTRRIAPAPRTFLKKVARQVRMTSLDNTYDEGELMEFHRRVVQGLPQSDGDPAYVVEPKIDGVSLELTYSGGVLLLATTRGDGVTGEDVTENARTIRMIPLSIKEKGDIVVRGEVFIYSKDLDKVNKERREVGEDEFANPRNAAAGSLRLLDSRLVARRPLRFYVWDLVEGEKRFERHSEALDWLGQIGLPLHGKHRVCRGMDEVLEAIAALREEKERLPYQIDGAVVKVDNYRHRSILGETARFPRWAVAFKYEAQKAVTRIVDIQLGMGRTGVLTPVAKLEPVRLSGTTVTNASLHNEDMIRDKDIRIGDWVEVQKAGEIIPYVIRSLHHRRDGTEKVWKMPTVCPFCLTRLERKEGEVAVRCPNRSCSEKVRAQIYFFTRRSGMDIDHLGHVLIQQLTDRGLVRDAADLYSLTKEELMSLERMAEKSASNVIESIMESKSGRTFDRLLLSLGIPHVGEVAAKQIALHYLDLRALLAESPSKVEETLSTVSGIGPVIAGSVREYLEAEHNRRLMEKLVAAGVETVPLRMEKAGEEKIEGPLGGAAFCITGVLSRPRQEIQEMIRRAGGVVHDSVKKGTDYLVVGEKVGSVKIDKARKLGTKIINEKELMRLIDGK